MTPPPDRAPHVYLSTACLHEAGAAEDPGGAARAAELHAYCAGETGRVGTKRPVECKFCGAPCTCPGHVGERPHA